MFQGNTLSIAVDSVLLSAKHLLQNLLKPSFMNL
jgi:hypothetical protein